MVTEEPYDDDDLVDIDDDGDEVVAGGGDGGGLLASAAKAALSLTDPLGGSGRSEVKEEANKNLNRSANWPPGAPPIKKELPSPSSQLRQLQEEQLRHQKTGGVVRDPQGSTVPIDALLRKMDNMTQLIQNQQKELKV